MESDRITKFKDIVAGLAPEKQKELALRMKGMSEEQRNAVIDRMIAISEQHKLEITAKPKVLANSGRVSGRNDNLYEIRSPEEGEEPVEKLEIVKNPVKRQAKPEASRPQQRPIKKAEPSIARAGRDMIAKQIEQKKIEDEQAQIRKEHHKEVAKKAVKFVFVCLGRILATAVCTLILVLAGFYTFLGIIM